MSSDPLEEKRIMVGLQTIFPVPEKASLPFPRYVQASTTSESETSLTPISARRPASDDACSSIGNSVDTDATSTWASTSCQPCTNHGEHRTAMASSAHAAELRELGQRCAEITTSLKVKELPPLLTQYIRRKILTCDYQSVNCVDSESVDLYDQRKEEEQIVLEKLRGEKSARRLFISAAAPTLSLQLYLQRLVQYTQCSVECYIITLAFLHRVQAAAIAVTPRTVHRLFLACLYLAVKSRDDHFNTASYYAQVGGVPASELVAIEMEVLRALEFSCSVSPREYLDIIQEVVRR